MNSGRKTTRRPGLLALLAIGGLLAPGQLRAFALMGSGWANGNIVMHLQLGTPAVPLNDGTTEWATLAESALNEWNQQINRSKFTVVRNSTAAIGRSNRVNNVIFRPDVYGEAFDASTLAVTVVSTNLSTGATSEADVIFNSNRQWNSYRGPVSSSPIDFRRVALHEFGHVLGLDHPDQASPGQNVASIMSSRVNDIETVRNDDITAVRLIYDGFPNSSAAQSRTLAVGESFTLALPATGATGLSYRWYFRPLNSPFVEEFQFAKGPSYTIGSVQLADAGTYMVTATSPSGAFFSATATLGTTVTAVSADTTLANISTRGVVGTGSSVMIAGFVVGGSTAKNVLVRAAGPALSDFGVAGALADPTLSIVNGSGQTITQNDNWETGGNTAAISAASTRLGAFAFRAGSRDSAVLATLPPGSYTAVVSGVNNATGIALVECYDADADAATARTRKLVNIATRGEVNTGDNVLIAGLVVAGPGPRTYLIRAVGTTLARAPFNLTGALLDPYLQIYQGDRLLRENDDWDTPLAAMPALRDAARQVGGFDLQDTRRNSGLDAAMLITLQPGSYTAKVSGFEGATGVALIEIYEMP